MPSASLLPVGCACRLKEKQSFKHIFQILLQACACKQPYQLCEMTYGYSRHLENRQAS